jgi:hypothetical protein
MTMKRALVPMAAALALSGFVVLGPALAEKGYNGGQMEDVAGVDAELLVSGNTLTFNIFVDGANKPIPSPDRQRREPRNGHLGAIRRELLEGRCEEPDRCRCRHNVDIEDGSRKVPAGEIQTIEARGPPFRE